MSRNRSNKKLLCVSLVRGIVAKYKNEPQIEPVSPQPLHPILEAQRANRWKDREMI